ncbi:unnamed protein product, partial [Schistosoma mattheei]
YIFKVRTDILIGELRKQAIETYNLKELDFINYGLYLPPESGKKGKFLQDERTISEYPQLVAMKLNPYNDNQLLHEIESNGLMNDRKSKEPVVLELLPKIRFVEEYRLEGSKSTTKRIHSKVNSFIIHLINYYERMKLDLNMFSFIYVKYYNVLSVRARNRRL